MKVVYKYVLEKTEVEYNDFPVMQTMIPNFSRIGKIGFQNGKLCLWAYVDKNDPADQVRRFLPLGTGVDVPEVENMDFVYRSTIENGPYVFHIFEVYGPGAA